tara:strand:- start:1484 stop:1657 length:174 start_codon:yes stop_codon:yes gene_type:complete
MDTPSLKIYLFNAFAFAVSFTKIDLILKGVLTIVVIGYTLYKWYIIYADRNKPNNKN